MKSTKIVDAKGLSCPMPIVRAKMAMDELQSGDILEVHTTDKGSQADLVAWADSGGHILEKELNEDDVFKFWIKKA